MLITELEQRIRSHADPAAIAAFEASTRAIASLQGGCKIANCEYIAAARHGFLIHLMFFSPGQELPLIEFRFPSGSELPLSIHLVELEDGELLDLSPELMKPGSDAKTAATKAVSSAANLLSFMSPEPNGPADV